MGGTDDRENLVWLTGREHYLIHWLLYKIHRNAPMAFAWERMSHGRSKVRRYTSHTFVYAKRAKAQAIAAMFLGQKLSTEHRQKLRAAKLGKSYADMGRDPSTSRKGKQLTPEALARVSAGSKGRKYSEEAKRRLGVARSGAGNSQFGKPVSVEARKKLSDALKAYHAKRKELEKEQE
jgi:hypothetical protein